MWEGGETILLHLLCCIMSGAINEKAHWNIYPENTGCWKSVILFIFGHFSMWKVSETWLRYLSKDLSDSNRDINILIVSIYKISQKTVSLAKRFFFRIFFANLFLLTILFFKIYIRFLITNFYNFGPFQYLHRTRFL